MPVPTALIVVNAEDVGPARLAVEEAGLRPVVAREGANALHKYEREFPSVVVLGAGLAQGDAATILDAIRAQPPHVPVIALGETPDLAGADRVLGRPVDPVALAAALREAAGDARPWATPRSGLLRADDMAPAPSTAGLADDPLESIDQDMRGPSSLPRHPDESLPDLDIAHDLALSPTRAAPPVDAELAGVEPLLPQLDLPGLAQPSPEPPLPERGELAELGLPSLLAQLHRAGFSGRLALRNDAGEKELLIDAGVPVHARSNLPSDGLADLLWREGRLTRAELERVREAEAGGQGVAEALVAEGLLTREEVLQAERRSVEELVYSCFAWDVGRFALSAEPVDGDRRVRLALPLPALVLEGVRRKYGLDRLVERVGPPETLVRALPQFAAIVDEAMPRDAERPALAALAKGEVAVGDLAQLGGLHERGAYALVHALLELGALTREPGRAAPVRDRLVSRAHALAKHDQIADADYFAVLGVGRDATEVEVERGWQQVRRDFDPERFEPELRAELADRLAEILEVVDEAHEVLRDDRRREAYRAHLVAPSPAWRPRG